MSNQKDQCMQLDEKEDSGWWFVIGPNVLDSAVSSRSQLRITNSSSVLQNILRKEKTFKYVKCLSLKEAHEIVARGWLAAANESSPNKRVEFSRFVSSTARFHAERILLEEEELLADIRAITIKDFREILEGRKSYYVDQFSQVQTIRSRSLKFSEGFLLQYMATHGVIYNCADTPANSLHLAIDPFLSFTTWITLPNFSFHCDKNALPLLWLMHLDGEEFEITMLYYSLFKLADYAYNATPLSYDEAKRFQKGTGALHSTSGGQGKARVRVVAASHQTGTSSLGLGLSHLRKSALPPSHQNPKSPVSPTSGPSSDAFTDNVISSANIRTIITYPMIDQRFQPLFSAFETFLPLLFQRLFLLEFPLQTGYKSMKLLSPLKSPPCRVSSVMATCFLHRIMDLAARQSRIVCVPNFVDSEQNDIMKVLHEYGNIVAARYEETAFFHYECAASEEIYFKTQIEIPTALSPCTATSGTSSLKVYTSVIPQTTSGRIGANFSVNLLYAKQSEGKISDTTMLEVNILRCLPLEILEHMTVEEIELHMLCFTFAQIEGQFSSSNLALSITTNVRLEDKVQNREYLRQSDCCSLYLELNGHLCQLPKVTWSSREFEQQKIQERIAANECKEIEAAMQAERKRANTLSIDKPDVQMSHEGPSLEEELEIEASIMMMEE